MNSNNYKCKKLQIKMNKKAQVAIFVIIAIVIVAVFLFLVLLDTKNPLGGGTESINPEQFLKECIGPSVTENVMKLSLLGGYSNPEGVLDYKGQKYKYLCYISENYKPCIVQQPLLKEQFEKELNILTKARAQECYQNLKSEFEKRNYDVTTSGGDVKFLILPSSIDYTISGKFSAKKGEEARNFDGFDVKINSQIYDLLLISISIIDFESTYGDSETTSYIQYYPDLKIEKERLSEGSKIYRVSNVVTKEEFSFATRSLVFPPGYGLQ